MIDLLVNKKLRKNFYHILELNNHEDIQSFINSLSRKEKEELFAYSYGYGIQDRQRKGFPIKEYFLVHIEEFMSDYDKEIYMKADRALNITIIVAIIILFFFTIIL